MLENIFMFLSHKFSGKESKHFLRGKTFPQKEFVSFFLLADKYNKLLTKTKVDK